MWKQICLVIMLGLGGLPSLGSESSGLETISIIALGME